MSEHMEENEHEETTAEIEFLELDELFEEDEEKFCRNCRWLSYEDNGVQKQCSLITFINARADKRGSQSLTDTFSCNRWSEKRE